MRGLHGRWFIDIIAFNILPTQVIGQNEYYIWLGRSFIGEAGKSKYEKQRKERKYCINFNLRQQKIADYRNDQGSQEV